MDSQVVLHFFYSPVFEVYVCEKCSNDKFQVMLKVFHVLSNEALFDHAEQSPKYQAFHRGCQQLLHDLIQKPASMSILCEYEEEYSDILKFSQVQPDSDAQDEEEKQKRGGHVIEKSENAIGSVGGSNNMVGTGRARVTRTKGGRHIETQNNNATKKIKTKVNVEGGNYGVALGKAKVRGGGKVESSVGDTKAKRKRDA